MCVQEKQQQQSQQQLEEDGDDIVCVCDEEDNDDDASDEEENLLRFRGQKRLRQLKKQQFKELRVCVTCVCVCVEPVYAQVMHFLCDSKATETGVDGVSKHAKKWRSSEQKHVQSFI